jgi:hypothetical protein
MRFLSCAFATALLLGSGCGKDATRVVVPSDESVPSKQDVKYPLFREIDIEGEGAEVVVAVSETIVDGRHLAMVGDPSMPLELGIYLSETYGEDGLAIEIHHHEIAEQMRTILLLSPETPPESRFIDATPDALQLGVGQTLWRLSLVDKLLVRNGFEVLYGVDEETGAMYFGERELTEATRLWFRFPGE